MLNLSVETVAPGSYIFVEDKEPQDYFYIIKSGEVQGIRRYSKNVRICETGTVIGIIPCMTGRSQTETVRAKTQVTLVKVLRSQYEDFIKENPALAMKIVQMLSRDLRSFNEAYAKKTGHAAGGGLRTEQLFRTACYFESKGEPSVASFAYYQYLKEAPDGVHAGAAKKAFESLKAKSQAVYLEPTDESSRFYPKGTMVFAEGQAGSELFIVNSGSVRISKIVNNEEQAIVYFKRGDMLGDMALLENEYRSANAVTTEDSSLLVLTRQNFDQMVTTQPQYIFKLTATLANRYWYSYRRYGNICFTDIRERLVDMVAMQAEMNRSGVGYSNRYATELGVQDLMVLCNLEASEQENVRFILGSTQGIELHGGEIIIKDVDEVLKLAAFYRKKRDK